jgi:hypothetical protein
VYYRSNLTRRRASRCGTIDGAITGYCRARASRPSIPSTTPQVRSPPSENNVECGVECSTSSDRAKTMCSKRERRRILYICHHHTSRIGEEILQELPVEFRRSVRIYMRCPFCARQRWRQGRARQAKTLTAPCRICSSTHGMHGCILPCRRPKRAHPPHCSLA